MILRKWLRKPDPAPRRVYEEIVAAARHPHFYATWGVPDTVDGRYDMIILHAYLVLHRLRGTAPQFRQELVDEVFRDMDRSLRDMGAGDLSVGKKVRKMAEVFYGRVAAYERALETGPPHLENAIRRNVFPEFPADFPVSDLARHVERTREALATTDAGDILSGAVQFPEPGP